MSEVKKLVCVVVLSAAVALGACVEARAAYEMGRVYGTYESGCEWASYASVSAYAEENHIPLVVIFGNNACWNCRDLQKQLRKGVSSELPVIFYDEYSEGMEVFSSEAFLSATNVLAEGSPYLTTVFCKWVKDDGTVVSRMKYWNQICNGKWDKVDSLEDLERFAAEIFNTYYVQLACGIPESPRTQLLTVATNDCQIGDLPVPSRRGFSFEGWFTAKTGGEEVSSDYVVGGDMTLYAHWIPNSIAFGNKWYEAPADSNGVICVGCNSFHMGANVAIPVTVTNRHGESEALTAKDITVQPGTYFDCGEPSVLTETEMREIYGWSVLDDVDNWLGAHEDRQWIVIPTGVRPQKGTHTFTVQVSIGGNTAKFPVSFTMSPDQKATAATVRFNANRGKVSECGRVVSLNKAIGALPVPEVPCGYTFKGWFTAKTKGTKITAATKVTKAMTVYAQWTAKKYKVRLYQYGSGKVTGMGTYATGQKVTIKAVPNRNWVFRDWGESYDVHSEEWTYEQYDAFWNKMVKAFDAAKTTVTFAMPPCDVLVNPFFIRKNEDYAPKFKLSGATDGSSIWYVEDGGEVKIEIDSLSYSAVNANKTIPAGMRLSKGGECWLYVLRVADPSKFPAGIKTIKLTAKNRSGKTGSVTFKVAMPNNTQAVDAGALALEHLDAHESYTLKAGVKNQWSELGIVGQNGWALSSVTGIPGLTWDARNKKMKGVPSKAGLYTATFTVTKGKAKKTATANFRVEALPKGVVGTFHGYTAVYDWDSDEECYVAKLGKTSRKVTVTIASTGKITAKVGGISLSGTGLEYNDDEGTYYMSLSRSARKGKTYTSDTLWCYINPNAQWNSDALSGGFWHWSCTDGRMCVAGPINRDTEVFARKNTTATSAEAKAIAEEYAKLGKQSFIVLKAASGSGYSYELACPQCVYPYGSMMKKTLFLTVDKSGKATLAGTIDGTKVSGTTYLSYENYYAEGPEDWCIDVVARFFVGKYVIEFYVGFNGRAWKK